MGIKAVSLIVESEVAGLFGAAMIIPPATMVQSVDEELAGSGYIRRGDFIAYVEKNGLGVPKVLNCLIDSERVNVVRAVFPFDRWACCGRVTKATRYNVVVAFDSCNS